MLSELGNRRFYVVGGLAILVLAVFSNYITFTSGVCILIILGCSTVVLNSNLNESRQLDFSSFWIPSFLRNSKSAASKESTTSSGDSYKSESRSETVSRSKGTARQAAMSFRQHDSSPGGSRLARSFGAVKSFLRSPKIAFGASSPMFSPKVGPPSSSLNTSHQSPVSLPKVHRIRDSFHSGAVAYDSRPMASAQRRYPTHQPQYSGLGLMPPVNFHRTERPILSERNSNMIHSPVTVKIAPPDVLKPPVPSLVPPSRPRPSQEIASQVTTKQPTDTASVLSAIREKRKRNHRDESVMQSPEPSQETKRRRQVEMFEVQPSGSGEAMDTETKRVSGLKRPAISKAREESISEMEKSAKKSRLNTSMSGYASTSGPRNAIESSFSSSRRWLEKQATVGSERITRSQSREIDSPVKRGRSPEQAAPDSKRVTRSSSKPRGDSPHSRKSASNSQEDMSRLDNTNVDESFSAANTSTPLRDTSTGAKETSKVSDAGDETPQIENVIKKKLFPLKKGSTTKRRQTPIFSPSNANFSKVPSLRYNLTVEDYAEDREADVQRVQQMLEDVDEPETPKEIVSSTSTTPSVPASAPATVAVAPLTSALSGTSTTTPESSALAALLDSTPGVSGLVAPTSAVTTGITFGTTGLNSQSTTASNPSTVNISLAKSPTSSNLTSFGASLTTSTASVQSPVSSTGAPKLPSFAEATAKTTAPVSVPSSSAPQYSFKPVFATEQPATTTAPVQTAAGGLFTASDKAATSSAAPSGLFSFGSTQPAATTVTTPSSTPQFGQTGDAKASTGGFQFAVDVAKTTSSASPFQFNAAVPSTNTSSAALPSYSSAISSTPSSSSSTFAFGGTKPTTQSSVNGLTSTASFNFEPSGTGITFGGTAGGALTTTSTAPTNNAPSFGTFGQTTTTAANAPKTTSAPGIFSFGGTNNQPSQPSPFGQASTTAAATLPASSNSSVFGQSSNQAGSAFGQTASSGSTGIAFGAPKKDQQPSSTFQFSGSSQPQTGGSAPFSFTGNASKQDTTTASSASTAFNFTASKTNKGFGQSSTPGFGGSNPSSTPFGQSSAQSPFGQAAQSPFGQTSSQGPFGQSNTGQNAFGQQTSSQKGFGSGSQTTFGTQNGFGKTSDTSSAFGSSSNNTTFGSTTQSQPAAFGSTSSQSQPSAFGSTSTQSQPTAFGSTSTQSQPTAFGSTSTQSQPGAFGGASTLSQPGAFGGASTQSQPSKGFDFGGATSGGNKNAGFNFGTPGGFGSAQTPAGGNAPAFGSPAPAGNLFNSAPGTPQNMFSLSGGNTAPRPRAAARTARRRTNKR